MAGGLPDYLDHHLHLTIVAEDPGDEARERQCCYVSSQDDFWPLLSLSGLVGRERFERGVEGNEAQLMRQFHIGLADVCLDADALASKMQQYKPAVVAFNGISSGLMCGVPCPVADDYGPSAPWVGIPTFVLPSSSRETVELDFEEKLQWWRRLADYVIEQVGHLQSGQG